MKIFKYKVAYINDVKKFVGDKKRDKKTQMCFG